MRESYSVMRLASVAEVWESCSTGQAPLSSITAVLEKQCQVRHWWAPFPVPEPFLLPSLTLAAQDSGWVGHVLCIAESPFPSTILLVLPGLFGETPLPS